MPSLKLAIMLLLALELKGNKLTASRKSLRLHGVVPFLAVLVSAPAIISTSSSTSIWACAAEIDPSVIDPVGKLRDISNSVARSAKELERVGDDLDKLNKDLDGLDKKSQKETKISQKDFLVLEHKYHQTIDRSEAIEKRVTNALGQNLKDIEAVRTVLKQIAANRAKNKNTKRILSDQELKGCLEDLSDLEKTVKQLQASLRDDEEENDQAQSKKPGRKN
jgi:chromosome segregation ATPase